MFISRFLIQLRYLLLLMYYLPYILYNVLVLTPTFMSAALNKPGSVHCVGNFSPAVGARNQVGIGLSYWPASLCSLTTQSQTWFLESILRPIVGLKFSTPDYTGCGEGGGMMASSDTTSRARICKRLWSPGIDSEESISPAYVAWRASTTNRVSYRPARVRIDTWSP